MRKLFEGADIERLVLVHPYPDQIPELRRLIEDGHPIIIPTRDPAALLASWTKHGKNLYDFAGLSILEWFMVQADLVLRGTTFYLSIDNPVRRDKQLAEINHALGLDLVTDWEPVRQCGNEVHQ